MTYGSEPLCLHCNRQPTRIVRMYGSQLVWLCELHYREYRGAMLKADGGGKQEITAQKMEKPE